ncbi:MAG TPA: hypothetical protein VME63_02300 [Dyella sp.]|uniref:hypothetical protein n=1 Tax=Dyella sp. TaxID=1869338 RepID=UPI002CC72125|nr:hypothetical protein [Dyella sp.]HTV84205.1 hypothetical protein [Dyella sp.]
MSAQPLPPLTYPAVGAIAQDACTLLHVTSLEDAIGILTTKTIFGRDVSGHANFSVRGLRHDLRSGTHTNEVVLTFHCAGPHRLTYYPMVGHHPLAGYASDGVFHVMKCEPIETPDSATIWTIEDPYWQSIIYPGGAPLTFHDWTWFPGQQPEPLDDPTLLQRIFQTNKAARAGQAERWALSQHLVATANAAKGSTVTVVPPPP